MSSHPRQLTSAGIQFVTERHLATFTSLRPDGTPHVTPVGFIWDATAALVRIITGGTSRKARNVSGNSAVAVCQVDGRHWLTFEGSAEVRREPDRVAEAVARYGQRYRVPRENPARVAIEVTVTRILGSPEFLDG